MEVFKRYSKLIALALVCGLLWRIELEYHGWAALGWISYFHNAIPVGFVLFMVWANSVVKLPIKKRLLLNIVSILFAISVFYAVNYSLHTMYVINLAIFDASDLEIFIHVTSIFFIVPLVILCAFLLLRIFGFRVHWKHLLWSLLFILVSIPVSIFLLDLVNHKGSSNFIHTIKSGFIIPWIVLSLGVLVLESRKKIDKD
ncbi:MAG: hypothetical protein COA58_14950 [Bacteroidetes bacterium]|nr:MAG: hypothetical protein COA58_14950 [Bacteroidota bacterium]